MSTASHAQRRLHQLADAKTAAILQAYFKTGPGEYGEGDVFLGIRTSVMRKVVKEFADLPLDEVDVLLKSPIHEERSLALEILVHQYKKGDAKHRERVYRFYLRRVKYVNNWDLVDGSARYIVGPHLTDRDLTPIHRLSRSRRVWDRRIAVLATYHFICCNRFDVTLDLARSMLGDTHDLVHKAIGWMLREIGKRNVTALRGFLDQHAGVMPRTMLRYAVERLPDAERKRYMEVRARI